MKDTKIKAVPDGYLNGYRKLFESSEQIEEKVGKCYSCKHSIAFRSWWCDLDKSSCNWEPAYLKEEISKKDLKSDMWLVFKK